MEMLSSFCLDKHDSLVWLFVTYFLFVFVLSDHTS